MEETKRCRQCKETKPRTEFNKKWDTRDRLQPVCRVCSSVANRAWWVANRQRGLARNQAWKAANVEHVRADQRSRYLAERESRCEYARLRRLSPVGKATILRANHGIELATSLFWANVLLDPHARCACCGIPNYEIARRNAQGPWWFFFGRRTGNGAHRHLQLGHIVAGRSEYGFVPMCHACNVVLGVRTFNAENCAKVLRAVTKKWDRTMTNSAELYWLNTSVDHLGFGVGGRLHRSPATERRDEMYKVGAQAGTPTQASTTA